MVKVQASQIGLVITSKLFAGNMISSCNHLELIEGGGVFEVLLNHQDVRKIG